jgi:hypothetical protein
MLTIKSALVIWMVNVGVSICWVAAEADIQFIIFDLTALKKQYLIFKGQGPVN